MTELSHDATDDGFHEIQLNGKQLVFLFIVTTLVSVAIFLCGVLVGRGARAARGEDQIEAAALAQPAPAPVPVPDTAPPPATEPPPAAAETPDELSYHKRLQSAGAPAEELKPAKTTASAPPTPAPETPPPAPTAAAAKQPAPTASAGKQPAAAPAPTPAPPRTSAADVPTAGRAGTYVIQVQALRDRAVAASLVKRLVDRGYPAFLVSPQSGSAPQFFKVQVGRYAQRPEAEDVKRRLEKEEQFKPWITQ